MSGERIAYVKDRLLYAGGAEQMLVQIALAARAHGYAPVVVIRLPLAPGNLYAESLREEGIPVFAPPQGLVCWQSVPGRVLAWCLRAALCLPYALRKRVGWRRAWERVGEELGARLTYPWEKRAANRRLAACLSRLHAQTPIALVHAHNTDAATPTAMRWAAAHSVPAICHDHRGLRRPRVFEQGADRYSSQDLAVIARQAVVVTLTEDIAQAARPAYGEGAEIVAIPNWTEPPEGLERRGAPSGGLLVAMVTRMAVEKGVLTMLEALRLLAERGEAVRCLLVGGGPLIPLLPSLIQEAGLDENVELRWNQPAAKVWEVLAQTEVLVLPSEDEGMPLAIMEALAMGVPVIATPVGAILELVRDGVNGLLVPVGDAAALAGAIAELARDPARRQRMGEAGRRLWAKKYRRAVVWPQWAALYATLIAPGRRDRA